VADAPVIIQVRGLRELRARLRAVDARLVPWLREVSEAAASPVVRESKRVAPHLTGELEGSIQARPAQLSSRVVSDLIYSGPIHFGWPRHNIEAQPFLYEGLEAATDEVVEEYDSGLTDLLQRVNLL
jgi:hypothetical protein